MHNVVMWIPAVIIIVILISVLVTYWQFTLAGLVIWALLAHRRRAGDGVPKPNNYPRKPVRTRPVAKPVKTRPEPKPKAKPKPARELPAPGYLPRWTVSRRMDNAREHVQWQDDFDHAG